MNRLFAGVCVWAAAVAHGFTFVPSSKLCHKVTSIQSSVSHDHDEESTTIGRRSMLSSSFLFVLTGGATIANAGIDPLALKALPIDGDDTGVASRLSQISSLNGPRPEDSKDIAFEKLPSGASYREYREGKGGEEIKQGSKVATEMTIRCQSFATANEPGGLKYYSTKQDTDFQELAWTIGDGQLPPELEEAMMGMHKQGVRRIELPSTAVFAAKKNNQLPLPQTKDGKRLFERLFKTDATLLFEVLVTRIK